MPFDKNPETLNKGKLFSKDYQPEKNGRPEGSRSIKTLIKEVIEQEIELENPLTKKLEKIKGDKHLILRAYARALNGDFRFWKEINDRLEGQAKQNIGIETAIEGINIHLTAEDKEHLEKQMDIVFNKK